MSLIPTIYSSSDPGAPQLSGVAGSLISVLRAVLVNGYGTDPNNKPGLGWTEEFTDGAKAVFRNHATTGSGSFLRVLDDGSAGAGGSARSATLRAFSSMSDIDAGLDPTPMTTQLEHGSLWIKSLTTGATVRPWWAIGNEVCFYLFVDVNALGMPNGVPTFAGDLRSFGVSDGYRFLVSANGKSSYAGDQNDMSRLFSGSLSSWSAAINASANSTIGYISRAYGGSSGAVLAAAAAPVDGVASQPSGGINRVIPYPLPINNGVIFDRQTILEGPQRPRGRLPGVYTLVQPIPFADQEVVEGLTELAGGAVVAKSFRTTSISTNSNQGQVVFDVGVEW